MQTLLPQIKQLLTDWYLLTLENPLYAGALVLSALLITVFFYSIRIYFLKRKQRVTEQDGIKLQGQLDETQQQIKQSEEKLSEVTEQMAKEQQLATEFSDKVEQRNQQIVANVKQLANKFNLSEQLVSTGVKPEAEFVWQQQDNIQMQLTERLQAEHQQKNTLQESYQKEKELFSKQKVLIEQLQKKLDLQISKSTQLEQDLSTQRLVQEQQINEAEQKLADKLSDLKAKHELDVASLVNELNQQKETLDVDTEDKEPLETEVKHEVSQDAISEETSPMQPSIVEPEVEVQEEQLTAIIKPEVVVSESVSQELESTVTEELVEQVVLEPTSAEEQEEVEPDYTKSNLDITGKFKSLFGKEKKQANKTESEHQLEVQAAKVSVTELEEVEEEPDYTKSNLNITGKFKNLFGKGKKQTKKPELEQQTEILADKVSVQDIEEVEENPDDTKSNLDITGKFKKSFAKEKRQPEKTEPEHHTEAVITKVQEPESEEQLYEPDYAKSNLNISGKFKKIFGKG